MNEYFIPEKTPSNRAADELDARFWKKLFRNWVATLKNYEEFYEGEKPFHHPLSTQIGFIMNALDKMGCPAAINRPQESRLWISTRNKEEPIAREYSLKTIYSPFEFGENIGEAIKRRFAVPPAKEDSGAAKKCALLFMPTAVCEKHFSLKTQGAFYRLLDELKQPFEDALFDFGAIYFTDKELEAHTHCFNEARGKISRPGLFVALKIFD